MSLQESNHVYEKVSQLESEGDKSEEDSIRKSSLEERLPRNQEEALKILQSLVEEEAQTKREKKEVPSIEPPSDIVVKKKSLPCFEIEEQEHEEELESQRETIIDSAPPQVLHPILHVHRPAPKRTHNKSRKQLPHRPSNDFKAQLKELASQINEACWHLGQGIILNKYCYGCLKIQPAILCFTEDLSCMSIRLPEKQETQYYSMSEFMDCWKGIKSKRFQEYLDEGYNPSEETCFSLVFQERSFDFSADDAYTASKTIDYLKFLRTCQANYSY